MFFVSINAEYASTETSETQNADQYGVVYALDFNNNQHKRDNQIEDNAGRDFRKIPENGLLIIRLLPRSMLKGTVLEDMNESEAALNRFKRSPGGGGCNKCGGGGGHGGGGQGGGGHGGGGGGGGASAGSWSSSSSGSWAKGG